MEPFALAPVPRRLRTARGSFPVPPGLAERLDGYTVGAAVPAGITAQVDRARVRRAQGYDLLVRPGEVRLLAADPAGLYYGVATLRQLLRQAARTLPCVHVEDWPAYPVRGILLDISRDRVPTMETLRRLIDLWAGLKYNQVQFYTEHTFAYPAHEEVWREASPLTPAEIEELDRYCRERAVELVPNQNSFGHMERWLRHPRYRHLADATEGFPDPWGGWRTEPTTLNPLDPGSLELLCGLYDELLPHFSSRLLNVGGDEPIDLGHGRSREACQRLGVGRVYLDFLSQGPRTGHPPRKADAVLRGRAGASPGAGARGPAGPARPGLGVRGGPPLRRGVQDHRRGGIALLRVSGDLLVELAGRPLEQRARQHPRCRPRRAGRRRGGVPAHRLGRQRALAAAPDFVSRLGLRRRRRLGPGQRGGAGRGALPVGPGVPGPQGRRRAGPGPPGGGRREPRGRAPQRHRPGRTAPADAGALLPRGAGALPGPGLREGAGCARRGPAPAGRFRTAGRRRRVGARRAGAHRRPAPARGRPGAGAFRHPRTGDPRNPASGAPAPGRGAGRPDGEAIAGSGRPARGPAAWRTAPAGCSP